MKKAFFIGLISSLILLAAFVLSGCATSINRTGLKTFVLVESGHNKRSAEKQLAYDAKNLCNAQYKIKSGEFRQIESLAPYPNNQGPMWQYIVEIECLGQINEGYLVNW